MIVKTKIVRKARLVRIQASFKNRSICRPMITTHIAKGNVQT